MEISASTASTENFQILPTTGATCLYRFCNLDSCEPIETAPDEVIAIMRQAREQKCAYNHEQLTIEVNYVRYVQDLLTIEFKSFEQLQQFHEQVHPLPIQFRYEEKWTAGFQWVTKASIARYKRLGMEWKVNPIAFKHLSCDPSYVAESAIEALKSGIGTIVQVLVHDDCSSASLEDLMVLDFDTPNRQKVIEAISQLCHQYPQMKWVIYRTTRGVHAFRVDKPLTPEAAADEPVWQQIEQIKGLDKPYLDMCEVSGGWQSRCNRKIGYNPLKDQIEYEQTIGIGTIDTRLLNRLVRYHHLLFVNNLSEIPALELKGEVERSEAREENLAAN